MDPLTHALSGAVLVQSLPRAVRSPRMWLWGALVAASPDLDLVGVRDPLTYIELHRTVSHSLFVMIPTAVLFGGLFVLWSARKARTRPHEHPEAVRRPSFPHMAVLAYGLLLLHVWLDCVTSYGTQIFWPFSEYRIRLSGLFIVSLLLLLPLAAGLLWARNNRRIMFGLLIWILLYPAAAVGARIGLEAHLARTLPAGINGLPVQAVHLTPDAFSPLYWKVIVDCGSELQAAGYAAGGPMPRDWIRYAVPPLELWERLAETDRMFRVYRDFAQYPILVRESVWNGAEGGRQYVFADLRFGSSIGWVDEIQARKWVRDVEDVAAENDRVFEISARVDGSGRIAAARLVTVTGAGGDSGWLPPQH